jgi:hypothetical protein
MLMISISYWHQVQQKVSALMNVQLVVVVSPKNKNQINFKKYIFVGKTEGMNRRAKSIEIL